MKTSDNIKYRLGISISVLIITAICTAATIVFPIETTTIKIAGSFAAVFIISAAVWKFPLYFYASALAFDIFAAALGSVVNLYKYIGFYDKFVHYLSGILLAEAGMIIIRYLFEKFSISHNALIEIVFAFFFSSACAGFWEIYEFTADNLLKINMQGGNSNTMGDIVSGVLGALTFAGILLLKSKNKNISNR